MKNKINELYYNLMMIPAMAFLTVFSIVPMLGVVIAFQKFVPAKGILRSSFIGLTNFKRLLLFPDVGQVVYNTISISLAKNYTRFDHTVVVCTPSQ